MWGDKSVIGDVTQAAYLGPWLWKLTAEKAGSFDIDKIAAAVAGRRVQGRARKATSVSTRTTICGARPASAALAPTASSTWFTKPPT